MDKTTKPLPNREGTPVQDDDGIPHTQIHAYLRRSLEYAQDGVIILLMLLLLVISVQALWHLLQMMILSAAPAAEFLSQVMFVLILAELYRSLIYYLREHRVSVPLMVEVVIVSVLREVMLRGVYEAEWQRMIAASVLLVVLGGLLAAERWTGRLRNETSEAKAH